MGFVGTFVAALMLGENLASYSPWTIFAAFLTCLILILFGVANPFREEYVLFHTRAGVPAFWLRRTKSAEFERLVAALRQVSDDSRA